MTSIEKLIDASSRVVFGKQKQLRLALCAVIAEGHVLIEDPPGMGKTTFVKTLAQVLGLQMSRVQFTNDLLPADVLGSSIFDGNSQKFVFKPGPIFSEIILGDELNRASPRTQSAFLQAMEEHSVSADGKTYALPEPFLIIATQNPFDHAGVYPLPESQLDRFLVRLSLGYPESEDERYLLQVGDPNQRLKDVKTSVSKDEILEWQKKAKQVHASEDLVGYVLRILQRSRMLDGQSGFSPRAGLALMAAAKAWAFMEKRDYLLPEDIKILAPYVLSHRLHQTIGRLEAENQVRQLVETTEIP